MPKWRVPLRLIWIIVVIQLIVLGAWLWQSWSARLDQVELQQHYQREHSELFAAAVAPALDVGNRQTLQALLNSIRQNDDLRYVGLYDAADRLIASLGTPLPLLSPLTDQLDQQEQLNDGVFVIETPVRVGQRTIGALQVGFATSQQDYPALIRPLLPAIVITLSGLLIAAMAAYRLTAPVARQISQLEEGIIALRVGQRITSLELNEPLQLIGEQIVVLIRELNQQKDELRERVERSGQTGKRLNTLLLNLNAVLWEAVPGTDQLKSVSDNAEQLLGFSRSKWLEPDFFSKQTHPTDYALLRELLHHPVGDDEVQDFEIRLQDSDGNWRWIQVLLLVETHGASEIPVGLFYDLSDAKQYEQRILELSSTDQLTGLNNRHRFLQYLQDAVVQQQRDHNRGALFFLDLDRFEFVNAVFGQVAGDTYLTEFSNHLRSLFKDNAVLGRLGGDEFGVIISGADAAKAGSIAAQLIRALQHANFVSGSSNVPFSTSIGISLFPEHSDEPLELLRLAANAMTQAKERGRGTSQIATESTSEEDSTQVTAIWDQRLRQALELERFTLHFQPIIDLDIGSIHYYECLIRLLGEDGRDYPAGMFFYAADRLGLLDKIERWSLVNAIRTQGINAQIEQSLNLTVNLSNRQVNQADLVDTILATTHAHGAQPDKILFEIDAGSAGHNIFRVSNQIARLREHGFRFIWDKFGIGALSFDDLRAVPFDYIKIDGELVSKIVWSPADRAMVKAISDLAQGLDLQVIAASVESEEILKILREFNIPFGQGRFFAEPAPRFHEHERIILSDHSEDEWG